MDEQVKITGVEPIENMLSGLSLIDKNKLIKAGLRAGANILKNAGKARLKERMAKPGGVTGNLLKSFSVRVKKNSPGALVGFTLINGTNKGAHAWLVDLGTEAREKSDGASTGIMPALKYWTDTRDVDVDRAMQKVETAIGDYVVKMGGDNL